MIKIFVAAPISGCGNSEVYNRHRQIILMLITKLRKTNLVYSELENIKKYKDYDSPEISVKEDFRKIEKSDIFILFHPQRMQTSTLIELGYAYALKKKIIIVAKKEDLPYLALGLDKGETPVAFIESTELEEILKKTSASSG